MNSLDKNNPVKDKIRFVTATTLFDGHDASINIIRRLLQQAGAEVIHLGHNRSAREIVHTAIQEGAHAIAASSYQGGHMEFFKYMKDLLVQNGVDHIRIFGGGGGVIVPEEIHELHDYGIEHIYSPEDGHHLGLAGMIDDMISRTASFASPPLPRDWKERLASRDGLVVSELLSMAEKDLGVSSAAFPALRDELSALSSNTPVLGITGTGGSGKSSLEDEFIRRFAAQYPGKSLAVLAVDPTRKKTGGALLGDRIRMNFLDPERVFMRSMATRDSGQDMLDTIRDFIAVLRAARFDLIVIETPGIGQGDTWITQVCDMSVYVMTSEFGAPSQLEKIDMLDYADIIVINKFDHKNSPDALRDVRKQYRRNRAVFQGPDEDLPIVGTVASNFSDPGTTLFFSLCFNMLKERGLIDWPVPPKTGFSREHPESLSVIPAEREHYLSMISRAVLNYHKKTGAETAVIRKLESARILLDDARLQGIPELVREIEASLDPEVKCLMDGWSEIKEAYEQEKLAVKIRGRENITHLFSLSLSGLKIPRIALPRFESMADTVRWMREEHLPGYFPYTAGVFPFRREGEDPKRQFAGEGPPEKTNRRFHYLSRNDEAKRLSTAFDSLTLYGQDPTTEPDIFGKIGESGVSICTLDDMKKLYAGFDLCSPMTSVSMTINGPAPIMLAFFFNTAIDQQVDRFRTEKGREPQPAELDAIRAFVFQNIRGTVQADILKEDQGQNSCIFSTGFALKMMGDIQKFFIDKKIRNFYSVSISGYHIAEAGANPVTQLALTLSNAFTYVEYYLGCGMHIDDFAPNLSFFFSSGMDPEYNVLIRVARRIWAIAMKYVYGANEQSQRLKCHVQTSGRSLHAQEMQFNDIRTTLQALMALNDNCNSLHTNSYDEAVTTPSEESVRRAMAIQLIIMKEYGIFKNQNMLQGSFIIRELTDLVEEAVLKEFDAISRRGGVLGAMETHYQRGKIQEESLVYEHQKHSGEYPIIGVNTYLDNKAASQEPSRQEVQLARASYEEKQSQLDNLKAFHGRHTDEAPAALEKLRSIAESGENIFEELMNTARVASLGQISELLYSVGGKYRRNM